MKKLNLILLFVLGTLVMTITSCKKKYSGCCKYSVVYKDTTLKNFSENKCLSDVEYVQTEPLMENYNNLKNDQGKSIGASYEYTFIDNGCSFHK